MQLVAQLELTVKSAVEAAGYEYVGVEVIPQGKRPLLRVYIDKLNGVTIDDCQVVSGQVGAALDVDNVFARGYTLEVSSPGLDRPLFNLAHYEAQVGKKVAVKLKLPIEGRRHFKGFLRAANSENIFLDADGQEFEIPFEMVQSARVEPQFNK